MGHTGTAGLPGPKSHATGPDEKGKGELLSNGGAPGALEERSDGSTSGFGPGSGAGAAYDVCRPPSDSEKWMNDSPKHPQARGGSSGGAVEALPADYAEVLEELKAQIRSAQGRALRVVNREMLQLYWTIGRIILERQEASKWGEKVIERLSDDLRSAFPGVRGFARSNLEYMRRFAAAWPSAFPPQSVGGTRGQPFPPQAVGEIPWGHVRELLDQLDSPELREWYAEQDVKHGWSRAVLLNQIKSQLHKRLGAAPNNFADVLPPEDSELLRELVKDPYNFEFAGLSERVSERELEDALVAHVQQLLLEMGTGFAFLGRQFHLEVGGNDFFIDLLFYNTVLHRYVVVELKAEPFVPEFAGKLNFYVQAVGGELATERDDPTLGILICADRNEAVVRYSVKGMTSPIAIARYELPRETLDALPTEERLLEVVEVAEREVAEAHETEHVDLE